MVRPLQDDRPGTGRTEGRARVVKVNVDNERELAAKYHVRSIPYLVVFKDGEKVGEQIGAVGKAQLAGLLDKALA